jgi:uncharacterized glyoxalase superfamily protein PhnB
MELTKNVPLVVTDKIDELKVYYMENFKFTVTFEMDRHLCLKAPGKGGVEISFMNPEGDQMPPFDGKGLIFCLEVDDVDAEYERLNKLGVTVVQPPQDNPWGDRSLITIDPIGINLYIHKPIPPTAEFKKHFKE